jgi:hypothetical protein
MARTRSNKHYKSNTQKKSTPKTRKKTKKRSRSSATLNNDQTKKTTLTVPPKTYFECSVCDHNSKQNCDYYVFVRVSTNCKKAWICGQIHKKHLKMRARYFKKGDTDPRNNYKVHASCWNLNIAELDEVPRFSSSSN